MSPTLSEQLACFFPVTFSCHIFPVIFSQFHFSIRSNIGHSRNNFFSRLHNLTHSAGAKVPNLGQTGKKKENGTKKRMGLLVYNIYNCIHCVQCIQLYALYRMTLLFRVKIPLVGKISRRKKRKRIL